ncbi:MAG: CPBP family intramembrane glutamic endopeptidase [Polyangia bacterium]
MSPLSDMCPPDRAGDPADPAAARSAPVAARQTAEVALVLASLALLALQAVLDPRAHPLPSLALASGASGLAVVAARRPHASAIAALVACLLAAEQTLLPWQAEMAIALSAYAALTTLVPALRPPPGWAERGRLPLRWIALVGGVTPGALTAWLVLMQPDLSDLTSSALLHAPRAVLIVGGVAFALLNAALEELIWRGVIQTSLVASSSSRAGAHAAILLQAVSFGLQHAHGFPRGAVGVTLAAGWAVMLGLLRQHSRGLLAPFLAHVVADATIAILVLGYVL